MYPQFYTKDLFVSQTEKVTFLNLFYSDFQIPPLLVGWRARGRVTGWTLQKAAMVVELGV